MDRMAEEILSKVGKVATLVDFASASMNVRTAITAFVLAGESDKAVAYVEQQRPRRGKLRGFRASPVSTRNTWSMF